MTLKTDETNDRNSFVSRVMVGYLLMGIDGFSVFFFFIIPHLYNLTISLGPTARNKECSLLVGPKGQGWRCGYDVTSSKRIPGFSKPKLNPFR